MEYLETVTLKNGGTCVIRNGEASDGAEVFAVFNAAHAETDFLLTYPDENSFDPAQEAAFLEEKAKSVREAYLLALVDGKIVGTAGIEAVGIKDKVRHRAEFGISVLKKYWGLGIGRALTNACIACAKKAGFTQLELSAVEDNEKAVALYKSVGFTQFGRNPLGFCSRYTGMQPLLLMRLELKKETE